MPEVAILASQSAARMAFLEKAGIKFQAIPAFIDEKPIIDSLVSNNIEPSEIALTLSDMKAAQISFQNASRLVIGGDQIIFCDGAVISKSENLDKAKETMLFLSGKIHKIYSACSVYLNGQSLWSFCGKAELKMRSLDENFIDNYILAHKDWILNVAGCFRIENEGVSLFSYIKGDYFSILGLPAVELLNFLLERPEMHDFFKRKF